MTEIFPEMDAVEVLRRGFLLTTCTILVLNILPPLRQRFIVYGPRAVSSPTAETSPGTGDVHGSWMKSTLERISRWSVPHSYFVHFYIVSVVSSVLWAIQLATRGPLFAAMASMPNDTRMMAPSMSANQIVLCWTLLTVQGLRRLVECMTLAKPSSSKMWFGHWAFGLAYYPAMGVAIWIEGTATLLSSDQLLGGARLSSPSLKTMFFLPVFLIASGIQHDCHCYLSSLKKYTLPSHPAFVRVICPHYTAECAIYLSLSVLAAPRGTLVNRTVFSGFVLAAVNLGVTAGITKEWYAQKFDRAKVQDKWKMIPGLY